MSDANQTNNELRKRLEEWYNSGHEPYLELDLSKPEDKAAVRSFETTHFGESLEAHTDNVEITADLEGSLEDLNAFMLIKYHTEGQADKVVYVRASSYDDPALKTMLAERGPGHLHLHVGGEDLEKATRRLSGYLGLSGEQVAGANAAEDHSMAYVIKNKLGMHARPSSQFAKLCQGYGEETTVTVTDKINGQEADGKSIIGLMILSASQGKELLVKVDGPDYQRKQEELGALINSGFGEM